jgi:hypothetical protein
MGYNGKIGDILSKPLGGVKGFPRKTEKINGGVRHFAPDSSALS